jgi:hypothetical protein
VALVEFLSEHSQARSGGDLIERKTSTEEELNQTIEDIRINDPERYAEIKDRVEDKTYMFGLKQTLRKSEEDRLKYGVDLEKIAVDRERTQAMRERTAVEKRISAKEREMDRIIAKRDSGKELTEREQKALDNYLMGSKEIETEEYDENIGVKPVSQIYIDALEASGTPTAKAKLKALEKKGEYMPPEVQDRYIMLSGRSQDKKLSAGARTLATKELQAIETKYERAIYRMYSDEKEETDLGKLMRLTKERTITPVTESIQKGAAEVNKRIFGED